MAASVSMLPFMWPFSLMSMFHSPVSYLTFMFWCTMHQWVCFLWCDRFLWCSCMTHQWVTSHSCSGVWCISRHASFDVTVFFGVHVCLTCEYAFFDLTIWLICVFTSLDPAFTFWVSLCDSPASVLLWTWPLEYAFLDLTFILWFLCMPQQWVILPSSLVSLYESTVTYHRSLVSLYESTVSYLAIVLWYTYPCVTQQWVISPPFFGIPVWLNSQYIFFCLTFIF